MSSIPLVLQNILLVVGSLYLLTYVYDLLIGIYNHFIRSGKNIVKRYGTWSVITGGKLLLLILSSLISSHLLLSSLIS